MLLLKVFAANRSDLIHELGFGEAQNGHRLCEARSKMAAPRSCDICHEEHKRALVTTRVDGVLKVAVRYLPIVQKKQEAHVRAVGENPHTL